MITALLRDISPGISDAERTFVESVPIAYELARTQHRAYASALRSLGVDVLVLPGQPELPDSAFVEDMAVVLDELAIVGLPGTTSRERELETVSTALKPFRQLRFITGQGRLEGGDVIRVGQEIFVGRSTRTNNEGIRQLRELVQPLGYSVTTIDVSGCLHLKTACTFVGDGRMLANPDWFEVKKMESRFMVIPVAMKEPFAANVLFIEPAQVLVVSASYPRTAVIVERVTGLRTVCLDMSELEKAEAGLTCSSILFDNTTVAVTP